jgi:membrane-bound serine protease (ClpP class)
VVDNFDQLKRLFGLDEVETVEPNWALDLVQALASPGLATFLLLLGFIGMYVELKTPGVGVGGVVAAVAFILFFWSKYLDQTAEALEIIMFISGLVLMLIEIFVVPGFGIFGLAGGLMVIFSLVLASQTFVVPRSQADMDNLRRSITIVAAAGLGVIGLAFAARRYLPKAPLFGRLVLEPPPPEERVTLSSREALANYTHLVGVRGEALTDLRPAGKALVDDQLIDVIALGEPLDRGAAIVVVEAHANRVVVRRA